MTQDELKQQAALRALDYVIDGSIVGVGTGSTANFFIDGLRDPSSQSRDMFAVEQVDVTKGPDSAYSGGGAVGGRGRHRAEADAGHREPLALDAADVELDGGVRYVVLDARRCQQERRRRKEYA